MNDHDLDARLKSWAAAQAPAPQEDGALVRRICAEARRRGLDRFAGLDHAARATPSAARLRDAGLGALAAAAVLLLVLRWPMSAGRASEEAAGLESLAGISATQRQAGVRLFEEIGRLFPGSLRWIVQAGTEVSLGTEAQGTVSSGGEPLLVRITILSRTTGEKHWTQSWASELILHGQDRVDVVPDRNTDNALALWVYPLADGKLALDTTVRVTLPVLLAARLSAVAEPGRPLEIAALREADTEYRIFQAVVPLGRGKG